jgi:Beta propeller domain
MKFRRIVLPTLVLALAACGDQDDRPSGRLQAETTQLVQYDSCSALERDLKASLIRETWASIERANDWRGGGVEDSAGNGTGASPPSSDRQEGKDYSGTNNQEAGVDEADSVKTDGFNIYAINGNRLHIFGVPQFGMLTPLSVTQIEGHPRELLLHKEANRLVVFSFVNAAALPAGHPLRAKLGHDSRGSWYWRVPSVSKVTVLDITNRSAPRVDREFYLEGNYQTARRIDTTIRMASYASIDREELWNWYDDYQRHGEDYTKDVVARRINALSLADLIPQIYVRAAGGELVSNSLSSESCRSFFRPTDSHARGVSSILSFNLGSAALTWDADHVISNYATFYASKDALVLAETAHDWWWYWWWQDDEDQLNVHAFDISHPGVTAYLGSGRIRGQLTNQFAIDEEQGAIRLATTSDQWWRWWVRGDQRPQSENHVWVLERDGAQLKTVGHIGGIARGEHLTAVRFLGDKGYLTTFRQIDPLYTVDLTDRRNPQIVGELKVPGFSTYLHPLDATHLLSIGVGGDGNGANWRTTISMFDVTSLANPTVKSVVPIEADIGWGWSEALYEHKAFNYFAPKKLLAVPQSNYVRDYSGGPWAYRYLSKLELLTVDPVTGVQRRGAIDHSSFYQADANRYWSNLDIHRSIFMGDFIYAISDKAITVHRLTDLGMVTSQLLPGYQYDDWWWGGWGL